MSTGTGHAGIVYWRRSIWNGTRCQPVLATLRPGELHLRDRSLGTVLRVDPRTVTGRLTRLGTLVLTVEGRRWVFVGRGASVSPSPSAEQHRALEQAGPGTAAAGGLMDALLNDGATALMRDWRTRLADAGARLR
ncbi:hypothetical protein [Streptomyces griseoluteus]|uniref:hypothetical protein n=1 Tax=Streptomyces griseoluteus TaxID=29306 RepID=UPI00367C0136